MQDRSSKRPRDPNQLAKLVVEIATGDVASTTQEGKNAAAVYLGRKGGLKGGVARAAALGPVRRSEIAAQAAKARWGNDGDK